MNLKAGIVGLPNAGKSTLFSAITSNQVEIANYPFTTIEPNIGIATLEDKRLLDIQKLTKIDKAIKATFKFVDIAGLVKGSSEGHGLGNKFLANIRDINLIVHVIKGFESENKSGEKNKSLNFVDDLETINLELILADLKFIEKLLLKNKKLINADSSNKKILKELNLLNKVKKHLELNKLASELSLDEEEKELIQDFNLLTYKPTVYVANIDEKDLLNTDNVSHLNNLKIFLKDKPLIFISAKLEREIQQLNLDERKLFLEEYKIKETGINKIIKKSFELLILETFFTIKNQKLSAWVFKKGTSAKKCAGIIHSDFEKGFIKVAVINYLDFIECKSFEKCKENGKVRIEGKNYLMRDGDICNFYYSK